jgi:hypothetical protein
MIIGAASATPALPSSIRLFIETIEISSLKHPALRGLTST